MWIVVTDTLARRYGWSLSEMSESMYWEDIYDFYEYACNLNSIEKNERMRFDFMLHAQSKKALNSWVDLPLPYPDRSWTPPQRKQVLDPKFNPMTNKAKMSGAQRARFDYVKQRIAASQKKAAEDMNKYYYGNDQSKWPKNG